VLADFAGPTSATVQGLRAALEGARSEGCYDVPRAESQAVFGLAGPWLTAALAALCPADLRAAAFPPAGVLQTQCAGVGAQLWNLSRTGLDRAVQYFQHPVVSNEALMWDLQRTAELRAWLPAIQDATSRAWAETVFDLYLQQVQPVLATLPQQFLHNDFNPYNLLVDPARPERVCGLLDFGDMLHGPRVFDVAVAASYQAHAQGQPRIESLFEFMQGYQQANPLSQPELRLVPQLAAVRCAITLCITERRAQWFPENRAYILRNHAVASAGLRALMSCGLAAAADQLLHTVLPTDCHAP
jgi:Ser/Thr protein kinase RdoA (MazF antagonist)